MALADWGLAYQVAPITLTGGIASNVPGAAIPLSTILTSFLQATGSSIDSTDQAFAAFMAMPGTSLIEQVIGQYPFANQSVAANAVIRNPNNVTVLMMTPMHQQNAFSVKKSIMSALQATLANHNNSGGTYTVDTPAFTFLNLVMLSLTDTSQDSKLPQNAWRFDFTQPLITLNDAASAESNYLSKITNGLPTTGDPTTGTSSVGPLSADPTQMGLANFPGTNTTSYASGLPNYNSAVTNQGVQFIPQNPQDFPSYGQIPQ